MDLEYLEHTPSWEWPAEAADTLLESLRDNQFDPEKRLLAAELAAEETVMNDELAAALLTILRSPAESEELRGQAAISLGPALETMDMEIGWEDPDDLLISEQMTDAIRDELFRVYLDAEAPKFVRRRALEASVRAPADWHAGAVRAAYYSGDPEWTLTGVFGMAHVRGFEREIVESLEHEDVMIRYHAVRAAGNWGVKAAWPHVTSIVERQQHDKALLLAAIEAVAYIRPEESVEVLGELIGHEDQDIAAAVHEALELSEDPGDDDEEDEEW